MNGELQRAACSVQRGQPARCTLHARPARARLALAAIPLAFTACSWFTDFKNQPHIMPWESTSDTVPPRGAPQNSVPITGTQLAGFQVSYAPFPATIDSIGALVTNPVPVSDTSLANGRRYYSINCAVCHGDDGRGNGPATKYNMPSISLLTPITKGRSDGYIYGMMRNGRGLMPNYNRIEEPDRWDVVNYVRGLQGLLGNRPAISGTSQVATGPLGRPGEGGTTLPGYSRLGPTRPVPYYKPRRDNVGRERNLLGDPAPGNDATAPPTGNPAVSPLADTTERTEDRDSLPRRPEATGQRPARTTSPVTTSPVRPPAAAPDTLRRQP